MAASADRIDFVGHSAKNIANAGSLSSLLRVDFRVFSRGPAHVAGLRYTTDLWKTPLTAIARFQQFDGNFEVWRADVQAPGGDPTGSSRRAGCRCAVSSTTRAALCGPRKG
jgi:hypothetical protein